MRVGVVTEPRLPGAAEFASEAERLGVDSLWVPEVWGYDALTGLAYLAAHTSTIRLGTFVVQLGSRSPALLATSALSLQELSGGRFVLGVGASGPRVMEGWHGVRFSKPVQTTRETIEILRTISRGERLVHDGEIYPLPLPNSRGGALMPLVRPNHVPVYIAAMGPANLRLTGELADGWLGNAFMPEAADVFLAPIRDGAAAAGRDAAQTRIWSHRWPSSSAPTPPAPEAAVRRHADGYAFTIGAMGTGPGAGAATSTTMPSRRMGYGERGGRGRRTLAVGQTCRGASGRAGRPRPADQPGRHPGLDRRTGARLRRRRRHHVAGQSRGQFRRPVGGAGTPARYRFPSLNYFDPRLRHRHILTGRPVG